MYYCGYVCQDHAEWKRILEERLETADRFEIHCWEDEEDWHRLALDYGEERRTLWNGTIVEGPVTTAFCRMLLGLPEPADKEVYDKRTPFFSVFLSNGFSSEHYGTELNDPGQEP